MSVQKTYQTHAGPTEPPVAKIVRILEEPGGQRALELQVNIGGQNQKVLLSLGALEDHGLSGPVAVAALREIADALGDHREWMEHIVNAIPNEEALNGYIDRLAERLKENR